MSYKYLNKIEQAFKKKLQKHKKTNFVVLQCKFLFLVFISSACLHFINLCKLN